jgi:hypothetical protein
MMTVDCDAMTTATKAVDVFSPTSADPFPFVSISFGVASLSDDDTQDDLLRSRAVEQKVLDHLDEPTSR